MKSFQQRITDLIEETVNGQGCQLVQSANWANCGTWLVHWDKPAFGGPVRTLTTMAYDFQGDRSVILFNGAKSGPPNEDRYHFGLTDDQRINEMLNRVKSAILAGKRSDYSLVTE